MGSVLGFIGKFGKGLATIIGLVLGGGGALFGGGDAVSNCLKTVMSQPASATLFLGALLAIFGLGRKAGWIGGTTP